MSQEKEMPQQEAGANQDSSNNYIIISEEQSNISDAFLREYETFELGYEESLDLAKAGVIDVETERMRAWTFIIYPESANPDWKRILFSGNYKGAISPLHNADYWETGEKKKEHFHVILYFDGKKSERQVQQFVKGTLHGVMVQPVQNIRSMTRYLAHMDINPDYNPGDKGKVRYSPDDIVGFGGFDVMAHIKATQSSRAELQAEMQRVIKEKDFTSFADFSDYATASRPDFNFALADPTLSQNISRYIYSRYNKLKADKDRADLEDMLNVLMGRNAQSSDELVETRLTLVKIIEALTEDKEK